MNVWDLLLNPKDYEDEDREDDIKRTCIWLSDAGFPQYVQMYNDGDFPISLQLVEEDHCDFDGATLMALFRRIEILNKSAEKKMETIVNPNSANEPVTIMNTSRSQINEKEILNEDEDDDEEKENLSEQIALSSNWSYEPRTRRWSHIDSITAQVEIPQDKYLGISKPRPYISKYNDPQKSTVGTDRSKNIEAIPEISTEVDSRSTTEDVIAASPNKNKNVFIFSSIDTKTSEKFDSSSPSVPNANIDNGVKEKSNGIQRATTMKTDRPVSKHSHHHQRSFRNKKNIKKYPSESEYQAKKEKRNESHCAIQRPGNHLDHLQEKGRLNVISNLDPIISHMESDVNSLNCITSKLRLKPSSGSAPSSPVLRKKPIYAVNLSKNIERLSDLGSYTNKKLNTYKHDSCTDGNGISVGHKSKADYLPINSTKDSSTNLYNIVEFSVSQVNTFKKLSVLGSTSMLERYCPSSKNVFNWKLPKLMSQKHKLPTDEASNIFGVNLWLFQSRFGQPYPPAILNIFQYLREQGPGAQGIFRKAGMKSKSKLLMQQIEDNHSFNSFDEYSVFDVADVLKTFLRDLPDRLLTSKVSATLMAIYSYVPKERQLKELQLALLSLPDENIIALEILIEFLSFFSSHSDVTKMDIRNLSLIFSPNLFSFAAEISPNYSKSPLKTKRSSGPIAKQMAEQNASNSCVIDMITNVNSIFKVSEETLKKGHTVLYCCEPRDVSQLISTNLWQEWLFDKINNLKSDISHKSGWTNIHKDFIKKLHGQNSLIEQLSYRKIGFHENSVDGIALRTWKVIIDVDVTPQSMFSSIKDKRHLWDPQTTAFEVLKEINDYVDMVRHTSGNIDGSSINRCFNVLRGYQLEVGGSSDFIVSESINVEHMMTLPSSVDPSSSNNYSVITGHIFCDNFIIESLSKRTTRVTWISKVDIRGHHSDWYSHHWGHYLVRRASSLKLFSQSNNSLQSSLSSIHTPPFETAVTPPLEESFNNKSKVLNVSRETDI